MKAVIETRGLVKIFRKGRGLLDLLKPSSHNDPTVRALDGVDLTVSSGEIFALLGPNGAGKTTLIKILCSLMIPDGGEGFVCGYNIRTQSGRVRAASSLVIGEERSFYWRLTGRQNLEFFGALYNLSRSDIRERIRQAQEALQIEDLDRRYQEYSTGNKHRLAIARSFLNDSKILFMDEPTRSLDPQAAARLRELIRRQVRQGRFETVFMTTHQIHEAEVLADRVGILCRGRLRVTTSSSGVSLEQLFQRVAEEGG